MASIIPREEYSHVPSHKYSDIYDSKDESTSDSDTNLNYDNKNTATMNENRLGSQRKRIVPKPASSLADIVRRGRLVEDMPNDENRIQTDNIDGKSDRVESISSRKTRHFSKIQKDDQFRLLHAIEAGKFGIDKDEWRIAYSQEQYKQALDLAQTPERRHLSMRRYVERLVDEAQYAMASQILQDDLSYPLEDGRLNFEEAALILMRPLKRWNATTLLGPRLTFEINQAVAKYLTAVLEQLPAEQLSQQTILGTLLLEVYMSMLDALQPPPEILFPYATPENFPPPIDKVPLTAAAWYEKLNFNDDDRLINLKSTHEDIRQFIEDFFDCLSKEVAVQLISSHGYTDILFCYMKFLQDWDWIMQYHISNSQYDDALTVLDTLEAPAEYTMLFYRHCTALLSYDPVRTLELLKKNMIYLHARSLLPALILLLQSTPSGKPDHDEIVFTLVLDLLLSAVSNGESDEVVHNYICNMQIQRLDDREIVQFFEDTTSLQLNPQYALHVCHQYNRLRAAVWLHLKSGNFLEAVREALEIDVDFAKQVILQSANTTSPLLLKPTEDELSSAWLMIARYLIHEEPNGVNAALALVEESNALLALENILPLLPDSTETSIIQPHVLSALDRSSNSLKEMSATMEQYSKSASAIRERIEQLNERSVVVSSGQRCELCQKPALTRQVYLFPCTHAFHADCAQIHASDFLKLRPQRLHDMLSIDREKHYSEFTTPSPVLTNEIIEEFATSECPLCGNMLIDMILEPFIHDTPEDRAAVRSWELA